MAKHIDGRAHAHAQRYLARAGYADGGATPADISEARGILGDPASTREDMTNARTTMSRQSAAPTARRQPPMPPQKPMSDDELEQAKWNTHWANGGK